MSDLKKSSKTLKNDMLVLFIWHLVILIFSLIDNSFNFFRIIYMIALFVGYNSAKKGTKEAGIIGIIIGILMIMCILMADIISCVLGIFLLMHSLKYNKLIRK